MATFPFANAPLWLQGRHAVSALFALGMAILVPVLSILLGKRDANRFLAFADQVCLPALGTAHKALRGNMASAYVGCPPATREQALVVPVAEVLAVVFMVMSLVLLSSSMTIWERFTQRRLWLYYMAAAVAAQAVAVLFIWWLGGAASTSSHREAVTVACVNIIIDMALMILGMAAAGRFYGLAVGTVLVIVNIATQKLQAKTGFMLRLYTTHDTAGTVSARVIFCVALLLAVVASLLWSLRRGQGIQE